MFLVKNSLKNNYQMVYVGFPENPLRRLAFAHAYQGSIISIVIIGFFFFNKVVFLPITCTCVTSAVTFLTNNGRPAVDGR